MLGSQLFSGLKYRYSIPVLILSRHSTNSDVALQSSHLTKHSMLMKSIARLASDRLQHVVINFGRQFVCNNVFRLRQKNVWGKICCPKSGFHVFALTCFCPNKIAADSRDISNHDDRTIHVSEFGCSVRPHTDYRFEDVKIHRVRAGDSTQV
jgi:hypothetical protein